MATIAQYLSQRRSQSIDKYVAKVELLDKDENVLEDITPDVLGGSFTIALQNGARRTAELSLNNTDKKYNLSPTGRIWMNTKIKIYTGITINGIETFYPQGVYLIGEPREESTPSSSIVTLQLYDKFCLLNDVLCGKLLNSVIITNGTNIVTAIQTILADANTRQPLLAYSTKPLIYTPSTDAIPYTLRVDEGGTTQDILLELADAFSKNIYFDESGYPRFELPPTLETENSKMAFTEDDVLKVTANKVVDIAKVRNKVRVVGGDFGTGEIFDAIAQDTNVNSATSIDKIGEREHHVPDDIIYTTALAQQRADYELSKIIRATESVELTIIPLDFIKEGDVVQLTDSRLAVSNERYQIQQITSPIFHDGTTMSARLWRTRGFSNG